MNPDQRVEFGMRGRRKRLFLFGGWRDRVVEIGSGPLPSYALSTCRSSHCVVH
jgi:hypothetical protein